jgi:hypothetical protein
LDAARQPYGAALQDLDTVLTGLDWPAAMLPDANALVSANTALVADLSNPVNAANFGAWGRKMLSDREKAITDLRKLETDLGLTPS